MRLLIIALLCSLSAGAQTYFVAASGNSTNNGLSSTAPWSLAKLNSTPLPTTCTVLFKRGDTLRGTLALSRAATHWTSNDTIILDAYGTGAQPIITPMRKVPNSDIAGRWRQGAEGVWVLKLDTLIDYTPRILLDGVEYLRAADSSKVDIIHRTSFANLASSEYVYVYASSNPAGFYSSMKSACFDKTTLNLIGMDYTHVRNLDVRGGYGASIDLGVTHNVIIENCTIGIDGNREGIRTNHDVGTIIRNNYFYTGETNLQNFNISTEGGDGVSIIMGSHDIRVTKNTFVNWRHAGIVVEESVSPDSLINILVDSNYATCSLDYGRPFAAYFNHARNVVVRNNTFRSLPVQPQFGGMGLQFLYNVIDSIRNVVYADGTPWDAGTGFGLQLGHDNFKPQQMVFRGNIVSNCYTGGITLNGNLQNNGADQDVKDNIFEDNIFINNGWNVKQPYWDPNYFPLNTDILIHNNLDVLGNKFRRNICYRDPGDKPVYYRGALKTLSEFNALNGTAGDEISLNAFAQKPKKIIRNIVK